MGTAFYIMGFEYLGKKSIAFYVLNRSNTFVEFIVFCLTPTGV